MDGWRHTHAHQAGKCVGLGVITIIGRTRKHWQAPSPFRMVCKTTQHKSIANYLGSSPIKGLFFFPSGMGKGDLLAGVKPPSYLL